MWRTALLLIALSACKKSSSESEAKPAPIVVEKDVMAEKPAVTAEKPAEKPDIPSGPRLELAGFSVARPSGTLISSSANSYTAGSMRIDREGINKITIAWVRYDNIAESMETKVQDRAGQTSYETFLGCDHRNVMIASFEERAVHDELVKSFRCTPVPGGLDHPVPEILDFSASDFKRTAPEKESGGYPETVYKNNDATIWVQMMTDVRAYADLDVLAETKFMLTSVTQEDPIKNVQGKKLSTIVSFEYDAESGERVYGFSAAKRCERFGVFAFTLVHSTVSKAFARNALHAFKDAPCVKSLVSSRAL
ncbi:MAG: hypothetical protein AB7T06_00980 [Kofleriaceae bacterium]